MNSTDDTGLSAILAEETALTTESYFSAAAAVVVVWYHLLTLDKEVALFWRRRRLTGASCLFLANRYLAPTIVLYPWFTPSTRYSLYVFLLGDRSVIHH
ncbi:hypothetical protein BV20DRAFT_969589 [Pilatotrama ljubarskyi]|nr:hypothetical protein BV20DRAFT_969589 [Pilatotrama ljubarskyi]